MSLTLSVGCYDCDEKVITNPDEDDIIKALSMVQGREGDYVILSRYEDGLTYIQTDGVSLEYQEGSIDYHYHCPNGFISVDNAARAFLSYAIGDDLWKEMFVWEKGFASD